MSSSLALNPSRYYFDNFPYSFEARAPGFKNLGPGVSIDRMTRLRCSYPLEKFQFPELAKAVQALYQTTGSLQTIEEGLQQQNIHLEKAEGSYKRIKPFCRLSSIVSTVTVIALIAARAFSLLSTQIAVPCVLGAIFLDVVVQALVHDPAESRSQTALGFKNRAAAEQKSLTQKKEEDKRTVERLLQESATFYAQNAQKIRFVLFLHMGTIGGQQKTFTSLEKVCRPLVNYSRATKNYLLYDMALIVQKLKEVSENQRKEAERLFRELEETCKFYEGGLDAPFQLQEEDGRFFIEGRKEIV